MTNSRFLFLLQIGIVLSCAVLISCQNAPNPVVPDQQQSMNSALNQMATNGATSSSSATSIVASSSNNGTSTHGSGTEMPAYYDHNLFTINFQELPPKAEHQALSNPS